MLTFMTPVDWSLNWTDPGNGLLLVDSIWAPYSSEEDTRPVMPYFLCSETRCYSDTSRLAGCAGIYE